MTNGPVVRGDQWTQNQVRALVAHARLADPQWEWTLLMRPETMALLDPSQGILTHPDPAYGPLPVLRFDDSEVVAQDLIADIVLANPVDAHGLTPREEAPTFWLDLCTGNIDQWTENSLPPPSV